jgi:hypothetical protein
MGVTASSDAPLKASRTHPHPFIACPPGIVDSFVIRGTLSEKTKKPAIGPVSLFAPQGCSLPIINGKVKRPDWILESLLPIACANIRFFFKPLHSA